MCLHWLPKPDLDLLLVAEHRRLTRRAGEDQPVVALLDQVVGEPLHTVVVDLPFVVERGMTPAEARQVVRQWRRFWEDHGPDFTPLDGPHRLTAMVTQTAYGRWLGSVLRGELGRLNDGGSGLDLLREAAPRTLARLGLVPVLAILVAAMLATLIWRASSSFSTCALRVPKA